MHYFIITTGGWIMIALLAIAGVISLLYAIRPWRITARHDADADAGEGEDEDDADADAADADADDAETVDIGVSVVLPALGGSEDEIVATVRELCGQQTGAPFEIIVVCRASMENRNILAGRLADLPRVYVTFIPPGSHNLSERKLAISLGVKAAHGDVIMVAAANTRIPSPRWVAQMTAPFANPDIEMTLGYTHLAFSDMRGPGRWYRQFDSLLYSAAWISAAKNNHPYRGDGNNIAFRRDTFFRHKGYAASVYLHSGDDDLFVKEVARPGNTAMVLTSATIAEMVWGESTDRVWRERKARYMFTSRWLPRWPFAQIGLIGLCQWLMLGAGVAAAFTSPAAGVAAAILWIAVQIGQIAAYRRLAARLEAVRLWWALPLFLLLHPLANLIFRLNTRRLRKTNYTWMR